MQKSKKEKEKQIRIPNDLHNQLKQLALQEGKKLERISSEVIQAGIQYRKINLASAIV